MSRVSTLLVGRVSRHVTHYSPVPPLSQVRFQRPRDSPGCVSTFLSWRSNSTTFCGSRSSWSTMTLKHQAIGLRCPETVRFPGVDHCPFGGQRTRTSALDDAVLRFITRLVCIPQHLKQARKSVPVWEWAKAEVVSDLHSECELVKL